MGTSLIDALADEAAKLFQPLAMVVDNPLLLEQFLSEIGTQPGAAGGDSLLKAITAAVDLYQDLGQLAAQPSPSFQGIAAALAAAQKAFGAIGAVSDPGGPAALIENLGLDVVDLLFAIYLMRWHPVARQIASLLTLVDPADAQVLQTDQFMGGANERVPYVLDRVHLERLPSLLRDPVGTLRAFYFNDLQTTADANAVADKLFPRILGLLREFGVPCRYGIDLAEAPLFGGAAPLVDHALIVYVADQLAGAAAEAGVVLALSAADQGDLGLVATPFGSVQLQDTSGLWTLELDVSADVSAVAYGRHGVTLLASASTAEFDAGFTATLAAPDSGPAFLIGPQDGSRIEVGGAKLSAQTTLSEVQQTLSLSTSVSKATIVLAPGDGDSFLKSVLPANGLNFQFDLGMSWSNTAGLAFHGAAGLDAQLPIGLNIADAFRIPTLYLAIRATNGQIATEASIQVSLTIGPIAATVDHLGMAAALTFPSSGGNLGGADLDFHFQPPSGVGLSIDAAGVSGGGFLSFGNNRYSGVLQLKFNDLALQAFGIITTQVAGADGYSLIALVDANFPPVQLGWGFTLNGVGGLLAVHRTANVDALRAAVKSGKVSSILFPTTSISNATQVLGALDTLFPTAPGRFLFGPMALIGWGEPTILTGSLAVILELPEPVEIILLAKIEAKLPTPSSALVHLNIDALGVLDLTQDELSLDASLFDSKLISFAITGDMALRANWASQREFLLAIGGFHPQFTPPAGFPSLNRVAINMPSGIVSKLRLAAYLAITSNSVQFGATLDVFIGVSGCGISGHLGFDALLQLDPFQFSADISGSVAVTVGGDDLASVSLDATLNGPAPWHIAGNFKIHIIFWDVGVSFSASWGLDASSQPVSTIDVGALLNAALASADSWSAKLPAGVPALTTTRQVSDPDSILAHPLAMLEVHERVVPLDLAITRFGQAMPSSASEFAITGFSVGGQATAYSAVQDDFAPAQFFDLSDTDKLARPSFERHDAGAVMTGNFLANGAARSKSIAYETLYIDTPGEVPVDKDAAQPSQPFPWSGLQFVMRSGSAARKTISRSGSLRYAAPGNPIKVLEPAFTLADTANLAAATVPAGRGPTYSDAAAALQSLTPVQRAGLQIIGTHELAKAA